MSQVLFTQPTECTVADGETSLVGHLGGRMRSCCFAVGDCSDPPGICNNWAATC